METKDFSKVNDGNHLPSLCQTLWNFKNLRVYTDLVIHCSDGIVEIHKVTSSFKKQKGCPYCQEQTIVINSIIQFIMGSVFPNYRSWLLVMTP